MSESCSRNGCPSLPVARLGLLVLVPLAVLCDQTLAWAEPKPESRTQTSIVAEHGCSASALAAGAPNPWVLCGTLSALSGCSLPSFPTDQYEYGFKYNSNEALVASCLNWNRGSRFVNRVPYVMLSDNPSDGSMRFGGAIFYTGTDAADDDVPGVCPAGFWRHRYWFLDANNAIQTLASNGCVNLDIYCRLR